MTFTNLIQTDDLRKHIADPDWSVVDCRFYLPEPDKGETEYLEEHIAGAVYAHLDRDLSGPLTGTNGRHPLPSFEHMVEQFSAWGIDDTVQVVAYDTAGGQIAARLWWMLRYAGHDPVAVLDGGFPAWKAADGPVSTGREARASRRFIPRARPEMRVEAGSLDHRLLIDARAPERFRGETEPLDPVAGHIPGARNHPTAWNLNRDGRFESPDTLRTRFESLLENREVEDVVCYCGSGVTACHNLLAMEVAGMRGARLYAGSWSEWCSDPERPVETGEA